MKLTSDDLFGLVLIVFLALVMGALAFLPIPKENLQLFTALAMLIAGAVGTFVGYRWGSSKGSQAKDATIAAMASPTDPTPPPLAARPGA